MASCTTCGADWSSGVFTTGCDECGGGAMDIPCPICGGECGNRWQRAVMDSNDAQLAHWGGSCALGLKPGQGKSPPPASAVSPSPPIPPPPDHRVLAAQAALATDPANVQARLDYAIALFNNQLPSSALDQFATVLTQDPANIRALEGAAQAALAVGDAARAEGYLRLVAALGGVSATDLGDGHSAPLLPPLTPPVQNQADELAPAIGDRERIPAQNVPSSDDWQTERPQVTLADVAGMEQVKRRLEVAFLAPLRNPELRRVYAKSLRGGLLLYGPPGCGKTFIARATAGELGAQFMSVGLSDVLDMWLGESERKLHEIFQTARRNAPTLLFFDELDALGQRRSHLRHHAGRNVVNQLLAELDGAGHDNEGLFVLGASNHPWDIDTALIRPGRFDRLVLVLPPDRTARSAILQQHLMDRPVGQVDVDGLSARTDGYSGADLTHLCESAAELALEDSVRSGVVRPIGMADFEQALREVRPSTRTWFETARNYALFANEGGVYDDLLAYMRANNLL